MNKNDKQTAIEIIEKSQRISDDWFSKNLPPRPEEKKRSAKKDDDSTDDDNSHKAYAVTNIKLSNFN